MMQRDASENFLARMLKVVSVFIYQFSMFKAQWVLINNRIANEEHYKLALNWHVHDNGPAEVWMTIEVLAFYTYVMATCVYIFIYQIRSIWVNNENSDIYKQCVDFITYADINLVWFAFNLILCVIPGFLLFGWGHLTKMMIEDRMEKNGGTGNSYRTLMFVVWGVHIVKLFMTWQIYVNVEEDNEVDDNF